MNVLIKKAVIAVKIVVMVLIYSNNLFSVRNRKIHFRFKDNKNSKYVINGTSNLHFYRSNVLRLKSKSKWISNQSVIKKINSSYKFSYTYTSKNIRTGKLLRGTGTFIRNSRGQMQVNQNSFYPQSIGTPSFPSNAVQHKGEWKAKGTEVLDFRKIRVSKPIRLNFNARYRYLKNLSINGSKIALIHCFYIVNKNFRRRIYPPGQVRAGVYRGMKPARLIGYYERYFYWDINKGYWVKMKGSINLILTFTNGVTVEWKSKVDAKMKKIN